MSGRFSDLIGWLPDDPADFCDPSRWRFFTEPLQSPDDPGRRIGVAKVLAVSGPLTLAEVPFAWVVCEAVGEEWDANGDVAYTLPELAALVAAEYPDLVGAVAMIERRSVRLQ